MRYNTCYIGGKCVWMLSTNAYDSVKTLTKEGDLSPDYPIKKAVELFKKFINAWMYIGADKEIIKHYGNWENAVINMRKVTARYTAPQKVTYEFEDAKGFVSEDIYRQLKSEGCPKDLTYGVLSVSFTLKECIFECSHKIEKCSIEQDELFQAFWKYHFLTDICWQNNISRFEIGTSLKKIVFDRKDYSMIYCKYFAD